MMTFEGEQFQGSLKIMEKFTVSAFMSITKFISSLKSVMMLFFK